MKVSVWQKTGQVGTVSIYYVIATMMAARFEGVPGELPSKLDLITKSYFGSSCVSASEGMELTMKEDILSQTNTILNVMISDVVVTLSSLMVSQLVCETPVEAGVTYSVKDISCTMSGINPFDGLADLIGTEQMLPIEFSEEKVTIDEEEPMDLSRISSMGCIEEPTVAPTTAAPTTAAPTTAAPTTVAPTTVAPTTVAPTTEAPTTAAPTTAAPTTAAPTTAAPTTVAPTTVAPTTTAPTTVAPTHHPTHPPTHQPPTHQPPTPTPTPEPQNNIGIWILVGVVALVIVVILCVCYCRRPAKKEEAKAPLV